VAPPGDARHAALEQARRLSPDHPGVTQLLGEEDVQRGRMQAALDHTWLALRRSPPSPTLLSLRVVALASRQQCEAARTLTSNADYLFPADCSASVAGQSQPVPCGESVRDAWNQVRGRCTDGQARLAP
jgi:Flp pilus assembly protein TadD